MPTQKFAPTPGYMYIMVGSQICEGNVNGVLER